MNYGYIAVSADGYIADPAGDVSFLESFQHIDCGYDDFIKKIDAIIIGKKSYETILDFGVEWPYSAQKTWIITQDQNLTKPHANIEFWHGDLRSLMTHIQQNHYSNTWFLGGGQLISGAISEGLLDQMEIFIIPVLLGDGIPLFPKSVLNNITISKIAVQLIGDTIIHQTYNLKYIVE